MLKTVSSTNMDVLRALQLEDRPGSLDVGMELEKAVGVSLAGLSSCYLDVLISHAVQ